VKPVKRLELVVDHGDVQQVLDALREHGITHYTVIEGVGGMGDRGPRGSDPFSGVFDNAYVLVACDPEKAPEIVAAIRPILARMGGMCLVSDAGWVVH
jgi:nitrogen regulatory protein PII